MPLVSSNRLDQLYSQTNRSYNPDPHRELFTRAKALAPPDQLLLELTFKNKLSVRQIGRIFSLPAGTVSRRVQRLCARLRDPLVSSLLAPRCPLAPDCREIALQYFAQKLKMEQIASLHHIPRSQVRQILNFVRGWHRGMQL